MGNLLSSNTPTDEAIVAIEQEAQQELMTSILKAPCRVVMTRVHSHSARVSYKIKYFVSNLRLNKGLLSLFKEEWHQLLAALESDDPSTSFSDFVPQIHVKGEVIKFKKGLNSPTLIRKQIAQPFAAAIRQEIESGALALEKQTIVEQAVAVLENADKPVTEAEIADNLAFVAKDPVRVASIAERAVEILENAQTLSEAEIAANLASVAKDPVRVASLAERAAEILENAKQALSEAEIAATIIKDPAVVLMGRVAEIIENAGKPITGAEIADKLAGVLKETVPVPVAEKPLTSGNVGNATAVESSESSDDPEMPELVEAK